MGTVYRTLVLRYSLLRLPPEAAEKISAFLKVQEEIRRWVAEWVKSGGSLPLPERNPLKYLAAEFLYARRSLDWLYGVNAKPKKLRTPLIFNAWMRLKNERDVGGGVFIDLPKREVRIRKWSGRRGNTVVLRLTEKAAEWIVERVQEGGRLVLAAVWVEGSRRNYAAKLYVALVLRREVAPMRPRRLLIVDFNALSNGISWAVVEGERIVTKGVLRPDASRIQHLQKVASRLDSLCARKGKACDEATAAKSRIWRLLRSWEDEAAKKLVQRALQYKTTIIADVPMDSSIRTLMESNYSPRRKIMLNFGRLRKRLRGLAEWHGISYREQRLYSSICPRCGRKMEELPNRRMRCTCGFEAYRDEVPFYWAAKLYPQLISFSNPPFSSAAAVGC